MSHNAESHGAEHVINRVDRRITQDIVETFQALAGGFKMLQGLGRVVKPLAHIVGPARQSSLPVQRGGHPQGGRQTGRPAILIGWKGYAAPLRVGAAVAGGAAWTAQGWRYGAQIATLRGDEGGLEAKSQR